MNRESKSTNDLFFTCSLIEYIARKTNNKNSDIVSFLGEDNLKKNIWFSWCISLWKYWQCMRWFH